MLTAALKAQGFSRTRNVIGVTWCHCESEGFWYPMVNGAVDEKQSIRQVSSREWVLVIDRDDVDSAKTFTKLANRASASILRAEAKPRLRPDTDGTLTYMPATKPRKPRKVNGVILFEGPSAIDGEPIVVIATGLAAGSANIKTGDMIQTWILLQNEAPMASIHNGTDTSICGACPLRGIIEKLGESRNRMRACYVNVAQAPTAVYKAYKRGIYPHYNATDHAQLFQGRMLRMGSYGDPVAAPFAMWRELSTHAIGHTGYTHQWRNATHAPFAEILMASCETIEHAEQAHAQGWRTFRTAPSGSKVRGEIACPASAEQGKRLTCDRCGVCNGAQGNAKRASVFILAHGSPGTLGSYNRMVDRNS